MMRVRDYMLVLCLLALHALTGRAEVISITHSFHDMTTAPVTLTWPNGYKEGVTPLVTYTCSENATFTLNGGLICISLPNIGDYVTISPAIDYLKAVRVTCNHNYDNHLKLYYSSDGSIWTPLTTDALTFTLSIERPLPVRGDYYLKIEAIKKSVYIRSITYYTEPCNCFEYVSE
jgi:hypothetical protein